MDAALPATATRDPPPAAIAALAARHAQAQRGLVPVLAALGTRLEAQAVALPPGVQARVEQVTLAALDTAWGLAAATGTRPLGGRAVAVAAASGAVGGAGGIATAIAELPVAVALILRTIQEEARAQGFDPADPAIRREALRVFASGSPLAADDGINTAFIGARLTLTGPALHRAIVTFAPRIAAALGPKVAAQAVPVLGAAAGAAINAAYLAHYRALAGVRFGLLDLARRHDPARVSAAFRAAVAAPPLRRAGVSP